MIIKVTNNIYRFLDKSLKYNIDIEHIDHYKDYLIVKIDPKDFKNLKRMNYFSKIEIIKYTGKKGFIISIKNNIFDLLMLILFFVIIFILSNIIVRVDIRHENKKLKHIIHDTLKEYNINEYTLVKSNKELMRISDNILKNNRDIIDFISITKEGMRYIINIEERIIPKNNDNNKRCHIVASKNGLITSINPIKGQKVKEINEMVHKGDIIISGDIYLNEEVKKQVCAVGTVKAKTWYKVHVSYPLNLEIKEYTGKERIQIKYKDKYFYQDHYKYYDEDIIFKSNHFKLIKEKEYKIRYQKISVNKAKNKAIKEVLKKVSINLNTSKDKIVKKVLKEEEKDSKIELDIFIEAEEEIGTTLEYESGEEIDS